KAGARKVRRVTPPTVTWPLGPRSEIVQNCLPSRSIGSRADMPPSLIAGEKPGGETVWAPSSVQAPTWNGRAGVALPANAPKIRLIAAVSNAAAAATPKRTRVEELLWVVMRQSYGRPCGAM